MVSMCAATTAVTVMLFYVGSYGMPDLGNWLKDNFDRIFLPLPIFLLLGTTWLIGKAWSPETGRADPGEAKGRGTGMEAQA